MPDWEGFRGLIERAINLNFSLKDAEEIEDRIEQLSTLLQNAA